MSAYERNYTAYSKHVPWGGDTGDGTIIIEGDDLSGAAFLWTFKHASDTIALANAAAHSQGVSATYDPDYVDDAGAVVGATTIVPFIAEATLEGLTYTGTDALVMDQDLLITPSGGQQYQNHYGTFTINQARGVGD